METPNVNDGISLHNTVGKNVASENKNEGEKHKPQRDRSTICTQEKLNIRKNTLKRGNERAKEL